MPSPADPATVRALLAVARLVHVECERAGVVVDDKPELVLAAVARWCEGTATADELRALRDGLYASGPGYDASAGRGHGRSAARTLRGLASNVAAYVGGGRGIARKKSRQQALDAAWICLRRLGEPEDAARSRVTVLYESERARWTTPATRIVKTPPLVSHDSGAQSSTCLPMTFHIPKFVTEWARASARVFVALDAHETATVITTALVLRSVPSLALVLTTDQFMATLESSTGAYLLQPPLTHVIDLSGLALPGQVDFLTLLLVGQHPGRRPTGTVRLVSTWPASTAEETWRAVTQECDRLGRTPWTFTRDVVNEPREVMRSCQAPLTSVPVAPLILSHLLGAG